MTRTPTSGSAALEELEETALEQATGGTSTTLASPATPGQAASGGTTFKEFSVTKKTD